jgi:hypothetical protein
LTWIKIDDRAPEHPKLVAAGPVGLALWLSGLAYCNRNETDGIIQAGVARRLIDTADGHAATHLEPQAVIDRVVEAGLWHKLDSGDYSVHDYLEYQPSREQLESKRQAKQRAGRSGGKAKRKQTPSAATAEPKPVPVPVPVPVPGDPGPVAAVATTTAADLLEMWADVTSEAPSEFVARMIEQAVAEYGAELVEYAISETALAGASAWRYAAQILEDVAERGSTARLDPDSFEERQRRFGGENR